MPKYRLFLIATFLVLLLFLLLPSLLAKELVIQITPNYSLRRYTSLLYTPQDVNHALEEYNLFHNLSCRPVISSTAGEGLIINKDFSNKLVFFEKQIDKTEPIASLTKLMTAVIAWENIDHDKIITLSSRAISSFGDFGDFQKGEQFKAVDLVRGMLLSSSNDAAFALAEQLGVRKFVFLMNQKTKELDMKQTNFVDPAGLSLSNRSTATDLTLLTLYILENIPEIFSTTKNSQIAIQELKSGRMKTIHNAHKLAKNTEFLGGKTGFLLNLDKGSLLSLFRYQEYTVCIIVLHGGWTSRYSDTKAVFSCLP